MLSPIRQVLLRGDPVILLAVAGAVLGTRLCPKSSEQWIAQRLAIHLRLRFWCSYRWRWYVVSGELKDMAARSLLLKLKERGLITLPARRGVPRVRRLESPPNLGPELFELLPPEPITAPLSSLQPLLIEVVGRKDPGYRLFQRTLCQHHYLGYRGPVGESIGYRLERLTSGWQRKVGQNRSVRGTITNRIGTQEIGIFCPLNYLRAALCKALLSSRRLSW